MMNIYKYSLLAVAGLMAASCSDIDNQLPEGGNLTSDQIQDATNAIPERAQANFTGMFALMGKPGATWSSGGNASRADGSTTASIIVAIDESMEAFTDYQLSFRVPEKYTNAYAEDGKSPIFSINVKKEDYKVVANGAYQASVLFEGTRNQVLEYSAMQDLYRIPDWMGYGTAWYFSFDGSNFTFTTKDGEPVTRFLCGVTHSTYGAIYANLLTNNEYGYEDLESETMEGEFYFPLQYTVSASSFGQAYEYLIIIHWLERPWETEAE